MNKIYWIDIEYYHETTGQLIGHRTNVKNKRELQNVLDRWEIQPESVERFQVDGKPFHLHEIMDNME